MKHNFWYSVDQVDYRSWNCNVRIIDEVSFLEWVKNRSSIFRWVVKQLFIRIALRKIIITFNKSEILFQISFICKRGIIIKQGIFRKILADNLLLLKIIQQIKHLTHNVQFYQNNNSMQQMYMLQHWQKPQKWEILFLCSILSKILVWMSIVEIQSAIPPFVWLYSTGVTQP